MLRHSRDITRFNRQRYIQKRKKAWWVRKTLWRKPLGEGYFSKFDVKSKSKSKLKSSPFPLPEPYDRAKVREETVRVLKDYSMR
jgi:hypothetical protein